MFSPRVDSRLAFEYLRDNDVYTMWLGKFEYGVGILSKDIGVDLPVFHEPAPRIIGGPLDLDVNSRINGELTPSLRAYIMGQLKPEYCLIDMLREEGMLP